MEAETNASFASIADLECRFKQLSEAERSRATVLLEDATVFLNTIVGRYNIDVDEKRSALKVLCCDLVQRKMESPLGTPVSATTMQAGSFMQTTSYALPSKKFRLYDEDLELLGVEIGGKASCMFPYAIGDKR